MKRVIENLQEGPFDLLVIGGGIFGAWISYDASLRGLRVVLIERSDWASETSGSSSKLIHGGLRYLEHFQLSLVKKSIQERERLLYLAPHRVYPLRFVVPIYGDLRLDRFRLKCGLLLYDVLAKNRGTPSAHQYLSRKKLIEEYPFLIEQGLKGGFSYQDCGTDDARLTLEIVDGAFQAGAVVVNYVEAVELLQSNNQVCGARVKIFDQEKNIEIKSKAVISATGPFVSHLRGSENVPEHHASLSKGVHLVMPGLGKKEAFLFTAQNDGRVFFAIPWYGKTLVGTTDTFIEHPLNRLSVDPLDKAYLLESVNRCLRTSWSDGDICGSFAGVRVLKKASLGASPSELSREWTLFTPLKGLFHPLGGKLTTARLEADQTVQAVMRFLGKKAVACPTSDLKFPWCPDQSFPEWKKEKIAEGCTFGLDKETAALCCSRYGKSIDALYAILTSDPNLSDRIHDDFPFCQAEVIHSVRNEMARSLQDILRRRIPLSLLTTQEDKIVRQVAGHVAKELQWSPETIENEIQRYGKE